jgi:N-acetylated-alpha-linked acidic dipeptidase
MLQLVVAVLQLTLCAQPPVRGFPSSFLKEHHAREAKLRAMPGAARIRAYMRRMSAEPHHAGSPGSRAVAEYALGLFKEWGIDARIETFEALLPYPKGRVLEMLEPVRFTARAEEPPMSQDRDSSDSNQLPTFNAYSADGDVTAPLLYVNYGTPEDYDHLRRIGIDARGKIVIARYGKTWRGLKPKLAAEQGAIGCIIYSDPRDDGYFQGDVYPLGPFRPPQGVQRGSVMDMPLHVGDPLTPGWASEPGTKRLAIEAARTLMKIPVLPISYDDASALLRELTGPVAPEAWRGALGFTYHIGPGPAKVHLKLSFDWSSRPVHNVIATIPGWEFPGQQILYGNHHDAWVNGANDPGSGAAALLEAARSLAELRKSGWQPKRTIRFALWDAEEFGLIGSTEWVEKHKPELERDLVAYLNSDTNGKGRIAAGGSHSLETFVAELLRDMRDPQTGKPLIEARPPTRARRPRTTAVTRPEDFHLTALGAGSDYVPFLAHAGIASLNLGFGGEGAGVYHSIYDTFDWYTRFADTDFSYGRTFSALMASMMLRLADAPLLPFEFGVLGATVQRYVREIDREAGIDSGKLELKELQMEVQRLIAAARACETEYHAALRRWQNPSSERIAQVNEAIYRSERRLLSSVGLPGREWYKHQLYAPGLSTGYAAKTLPAVREASEENRWEDANLAIRVVSQSIRNLHDDVVRISTLLKSL